MAATSRAASQFAGPRLFWAGAKADRPTQFPFRPAYIRRGGRGARRRPRPRQQAPPHLAATFIGDRISVTSPVVWDVLQPSLVNAAVDLTRRTRIPIMDTCPTELHLYICQLASSVDDGRTIRSLASVSHYYRSLAHHLIHTSVSLSSATRIIDFAEKLEGEDGALRRGVKHLFISDRHTSPTHRPRSQHVQESIARVLSLTGPSLETLSIHCSSLLSSATLLAHTAFRIPFPRLEELTVHGLYPFPSDTHTRLPRLQRLHLSGHRNPHGLLQLGGIETACPDLRVLRVDGVSGAPAFARELQQAMCELRDPHPLDDEPAGSTLELFPARLPPFIECVAVQPAKSEARSAGRAVKENAMMRVFESMSEEFANGAGEDGDGIAKGTAGSDGDDLAFALIKPPTGAEDMCTVMRDLWARRIGGGDDGLIYS